MVKARGGGEGEGVAPDQEFGDALLHAGALGGDDPDFVDRLDLPALADGLESVALRVLGQEGDGLGIGEGKQFGDDGPGGSDGGEQEVHGS